VPRGTQDTCTVGCLSPTGFSPSLMLLSNSFGSVNFLRPRSYNPSLVETRLVWAAPISLATTLGISVDFFSSGY
jgi:hypothetical protein